MDAIIKLNPERVSVLIGTNDANASLTEKDAKFYKKYQKLPQDPDEAFFIDNLNNIVRRFKSETSAKSCLVSLPTIGEDITQPEYSIAQKYSGLIKKIAIEHEVDFLPLFEKMDETLQTRDFHELFSHEQGNKAMLIAIIKHYLVGFSWTRIAKQRKFLFHIDQLHLNEQGAELVSDLITDWASSSP